MIPRLWSLCGRSPEARHSPSGNCSCGDWPLSIAETAPRPRPTGTVWMRTAAPFRIVKRLRSLEDGKTTTAGPGANIAALESMVFGESILPRLSELNTLVSKQQWTEILRRIPALRASLLRVDPRLAADLTGALIGPLVLEAAERDYDSGRRLILDFIRVSEPMPIDPSWNRLWGLVWEGPQGDPLEAVPFWTKYLDNLENVPGLSAEERPLARALVCNHLAELYLEGADDLSQDDGIDPDYDDFDEDVDDDDDEVEIDIETAKQKAIEFLERSLSLAPRHRPTFELLAETYQEWGQPEKVEETYRRILDLFPDDLEALTRLASVYYDKNEPAQALVYLQRGPARSSPWTRACSTEKSRLAPGSAQPGTRETVGRRTRPVCHHRTA